MTVYEFLAYRVDHVMTTEPVTITPTTTLREAQRIFEAHDFDALPVLQGERLVGMLSKLDLCRAFVFTTDTVVPPYDDIVDRHAADVMSRDVAPVDPELPLTRVLESMVDASRKSFPVVDTSGRLVGIVAREDVLGAIRRAAEGQGPPEELRRS